MINVPESIGPTDGGGRPPFVPQEPPSDATGSPAPPIGKPRLRPSHYMGMLPDEGVFRSPIPLGWFQNVGIVFECDPSSHYESYWSIEEVNPESMPRPIPRNLMPVIEREGHLALSDGRLVLIDRFGGFIIGAERRERLEFGRPGREAVVRWLSIAGALKDGSVVVEEFENIRDPEEPRSPSLQSTFILERGGQSRRPDCFERWRWWITSTGHLAWATESGVESGLDVSMEAIESVATAEELREFLSLPAEQWISGSIRGVECDHEGTWSILVMHGDCVDAVQRTKEGQLIYCGGYEGIPHQWDAFLAQVYQTMSVIAFTDEDQDSREIPWGMVDVSREADMPQDIRMTAPLIPLGSGWFLIRAHNGATAPRSVYLSRTGTYDFTPVDDLDLGPDSFRLRSIEAIDGTLRVDIGDLVRDTNSGAVRLVIHRRRLDPDTPALVESENKSWTCLVAPGERDDISFCQPIGDSRLAIGYRSCRCEIIEVPSHHEGLQERRVLATGYLLSPANSMAIACGPGEEQFLVVAAGERVERFKIPSDTLSA